MATIKVEVTYDPKKETLSQALASLLTEKPEHTEITAQMSLSITQPPQKHLPPRPPPRRLRSPLRSPRLRPLILSLLRRRRSLRLT